jgi:O-antigen ligase/polysaccharide polymerase Wzy-like membrane protein
MSICANLCRRIDRAIDSRPGETGRLEARLTTLAAAFVPGLAVAILGLAGGGYSAPTWGWSTLALVGAAIAALIAFGKPQPSRLEYILVGALTGLSAWALLSTAWSQDVAQSVLEAERSLLYVAAAVAVLLVARRASVPYLLGGLLVAVAVVCGYALSLRLFPESLDSGGVPLTSDPEAAFKLAQPLGYANALGALAAIGLVLSLLLAARAATEAAVPAAASSPLFAVTLYLTFGRGAWLALLAGVLVALALDPRRVQLITGLFALVPVPALAVLLTSRLDSLTSRPGSVDEIADDGRRLAVALVLFAVMAAASAFVLRHAERRLHPGRRAAAAYGRALVCLAAGLVVAVLVVAGGPFRLATRAYDAFNAPPAPREGDVGRRLLTFSGSSRSDYWRVAWDEVEDRPLLGSGAGSYQRDWLRERPADLPVRDAHSLYLETLAELGPVGLLLLLAALAAPLAAAVRTRGQPLVPAAVAAYCCFLIHAGVDWDWEMPAVSIAALSVGATLLVAARGSDRTRRATGRVLAVSVAAASAASVVTVVALTGNLALERSSEALDRGDSEAAKREARVAARWAPWSSEPWRLLGEARLTEGDLAGARSDFHEGLAKDERSWELWLDLALASEGAERSRALGRATALNPRARELGELRAEG